ncbi:coronamic acid biosynthesis protein CmaL [Pseudonocardia ailaonensis]|uniref:Coronamic acid biosynthesis protein CmaL n=1 Tax=Pseudonocardia ailaonensis TaxID=367279 RepID=A0ABN2N1B3_9PSEU
MTAYWIARAAVLDPEQYGRYAERVPAILAEHGGRILARGGAYRTLEGPEEFERFVVVEFPSMDDAVRCFESPAYVEAAAFRRGGAGRNELTIVEGF